jgi:N-formylglutamate amidohydrolase
VPHAGLTVPPEAQPYCALTTGEIIQDGDEGAAEIYALESQVAAFVTTEIARAIVDMNREESDRRADGVVKTHTCWNVPVYHEFPPDDAIEALLARYYRPYHERLTAAARQNVVLGVDCHTMAAKGPPIGPRAGIERPRICLSNADGTCPQAWMKSLAGCFERSFECSISVNDPFKGGYLIRSHAGELPWVQLELSRAPFLTSEEKRERVLAALGDWCAKR